MKRISICIPTYEMHGKGTAFLKHSLNRLTKQTYTDFNVVVSDNSNDHKIKNLCETYKDTLEIIYIKNPSLEKTMISNINNAINHANGEIIKILFQDDFLYKETSLETIANNFEKEDIWMITGCIHTKNGTQFAKPTIPTYNKNLYLGENTLGSPSTLTIKREKVLSFDKNLTWLMDCDYYRRCYDAYGLPKIVPTVTVAIRTGDHQITNNEATERLKHREYLYVLKKYDKGLPYWSKKLLKICKHILRKIKRQFLSQA